jgi:Rieske Fe-S protein
MPEHGSEPSQTEVTRRVMLRGAAVSGVALPLLAACGDDPETAGTPAGGTGSEPGGGASPTGSGETGALASTSDIPVGGGQIIKDQQIVVTQPAEGDFKAFTAVCTHQQCTVTSVQDGIIQCPCHGSQFSVEDGSVQGGPAPAPLEEIPITVEGSTITLA